MRVLSAVQVMKKPTDALMNWMSAQGVEEFFSILEQRGHFEKHPGLEQTTKLESLKKIKVANKHKVDHDASLRRWFQLSFQSPAALAKTPEQIALGKWYEKCDYTFKAVNVPAFSEIYQFEGPELPFLLEHKSTKALMAANVACLESLDYESACTLVAQAAACSELRNEPIKAAVILKVNGPFVTECKVRSFDALFQCFLLELARKRNELKLSGRHVSELKRVV